MAQKIITRGTLQAVREQTSSELTNTDNRVDLLDAYAVAAAYGGVRLATPVGLPDLGAGFTTMQADAGSLAVPRGIVQDFANDGLRFSLLSILSVSINITLLHNEDNASRTTQVRLFNVTDAVGSPPATIGIARNQPATNIAATLLLEIPTANLGDLFVVQIGNGDTLTAVTEEEYSFNAFAVSEFRG